MANKNEYPNDPHRRSFVKGAGIAGLGLAGAVMLGKAIPAAAQSTTPATTPTEADVINFALNLEYLEAEFYSVATYGATLVDLGIIDASMTTGPTTGGHVVAFNVSDPGKPSSAFLASEIRKDEQSHVKILRAALASAAVPKPAINLDALGIGFGSEAEFLVLARAFEDVGISAYAGAISLLKTPAYLATAGAIALTEGQHSGSIRSNIVELGIPTTPVDKKDVIPTPDTPFFVDQNGLSISRTVQEVLRIVYAGGTTSGGFFPVGVNGTINSAA